MAFLELQGLVKSFGTLRVIDTLDLELDTGELLCIIGPNGCGKTTLFNLICGELKPDNGLILLEGSDIASLKPFEVARRGVVRKFQVPSIYEELTVSDNIAVAANAGKADRDVLGEIGLEERAGVLAGILSHGEKQWLEIGMVLATKPRLVLLDEPTAGMTRNETARTVELINQIHHQRGLSMIMIEHDMRFVEALDSDVAVMMDGNIISRGSYQEVSKIDAVKEAYLGTAPA